MTRWLIERRVYTLHRGMAGRFWTAQDEWNRTDPDQLLRKSLIGYFSGIGEERDRIVHLYAFSGFGEREEAYSAFYTARDPEYFGTVRPWVLRQECDLFSSVPGVDDEWIRTPRNDGSTQPFMSRETGLLLETEIDFPPSKGVAAQTVSASSASFAPVARLTALTGRLHRQLHYEWISPPNRLLEAFNGTEGPNGEALPRALGARSKILAPTTVASIQARVPVERPG